MYSKCRFLFCIRCKITLKVYSCLILKFKFIVLLILKVTLIATHQVTQLVI